MNEKLFQIAAICRPNEKQDENGEKAKVIVEVQTVLAKDQNTAIMLAARAIPDAYKDQLSQIEVAVRPF